MGIVRLIKIVLLIIIALNASSQINNNLPIKLSLNRTKFHKNDTLKLSITNVSSDTFLIASICCSKDCIKLMLKKKKVWKELIIHGFDNGSTSGGRYKFLPGEKIDFQWDQTYLIDYIPPYNREFVPKGIYRIEFNFGTYTKIPKYPSERYVCYSKTFRIK